MSTCVICGEPFYPESEIDSAERCWCGEMASGDLWGWDRWRAYRNYLRYRLARWMIDCGVCLGRRGSASLDVLSRR